VKSHVATQLIQSGTSIGANVEEAKAAYSRREFATIGMPGDTNVVTAG
jgi:four helix bundle protein